MTVTLYIGPKEVFDVNMPDSQLMAIVKTFVNVEKRYLRAVMEKNQSLRDFINSTRFQVEYARLTDQLDSIPAAEWLDEQISDGGFRFMTTRTFRFNLREIVFDHTRHGLRELDVPFESVPGISAVHDLQNCVAPDGVKNVFVVQNLNMPVMRFDPGMFFETWAVCMLRPGFVMRGRIACPKGDYGVVKIGFEVGDGRTEVAREDVTIGFKEREAHGEFIPFEVRTPEYKFRATQVYVTLMVFYVNRTELVHPGVRLSNCTIRATLPARALPVPAERFEPLRSEGPHGPEHIVPFRVVADDEPDGLRRLREHFFSVVDNARVLRDEQLARAEHELDILLAGDLLAEPMDETAAAVGAKRANDNSKKTEEEKVGKEHDERLEPEQKRQKLVTDEE